jgi:hypothetical protein
MKNDYWQEGFDAYLLGKHQNDNPYPEFNDKRFDEWDEGFFDAEENSTGKIN